MSAEERERLQAKEEHKNPGGSLNNVLARAMTGSPNRGCLINIGSIVMIIVFLFLFRACSN